MKTRLITTVALTLLSGRLPAQDAFGFFRGDVFPPARENPAAWLLELHKADALLNANIAVAEFLPNTKLAWHNHPGGQILVVTDGVGYYQEKGKPRLIVRTGDVIKCAPGVEHWHGASIEGRMTYIAISPAQKGGTVWGQQVTDVEYASAATDVRSAPKARKIGAATLHEIHKADAIFPFDVVSATFEPGKRLDWHKDSGGQILVFTEGAGYYQEKGQAKRVVRKGDVITSAPGTEHWHGAAAEIGVTHIAITPSHEAGTIWLQKVGDKEYSAP